jgi:hypothetical protein
MKLYEVNQGITEQEIEEYLPILEGLIKGKISDSLIEIWKEHNGFHGVDEDEDMYAQIWFYSIAECIEFNQYTHIPGYLIIADEDGGDEVVMMKVGKESKEIFTNERGILRPTCIQGLEKIIFRTDPVTKGWGDAIVRLDIMPSDGLKGLNRIKKILGKDDWSMQKLLEIKLSIPYELIVTYYAAANGAAFKINQYEKCASLWKASDPTCEMLIWPPE